MSRPSGSAASSGFELRAQGTDVDRRAHGILPARGMLPPGEAAHPGIHPFAQCRVPLRRCVQGPDHAGQKGPGLRVRLARQLGHHLPLLVAHHAREVGVEPLDLLGRESLQIGPLSAEGGAVLFHDLRPA